PAPRSVGKRASAAGHGVDTHGSEHALVFRTLKTPADVKEHAVFPISADDDRSAAKVPWLSCRHVNGPVKFPKCVAEPEVLTFNWVSPPGRCVTPVIVPVPVAVNDTCSSVAVTLLFV